MVVSVWVLLKCGLFLLSHLFNVIWALFKMINVRITFSSSFFLASTCYFCSFCFHYRLNTCVCVCMCLFFWQIWITNDFQLIPCQKMSRYLVYVKADKLMRVCTHTTIVCVVNRQYLLFRWQRISVLRFRLFSHLIHFWHEFYVNLWLIVNLTATIHMTMAATFTSLLVLFFFPSHLSYQPICIVP